MLLGVACLKKPVLVLVVCALLVFVLSCGYGGTSSSNTTGGTTGLKFRGVVSQNVQGIIFAGLILIDAEKDKRAPAQPIGSSFLPGMLVESNDHKITLAVNSTFNAIEVMDNVKEATTLNDLALPGATESVVISVDNTKAYAAVPSAQVPGGGSAGGIAIASLAAGSTTTSTLPIPSAHFLAQSGDGSRLLAFSDNSNTVTVVSPFNIQSGQRNATCNPPAPDPVVCQEVPGFDRPVAGFFSSDNTQAWVLNCGPECGGVQASVQVIDLHDPAHPVAGVATPIPGGATVGFIKGQTLYVAGNPPAGSNMCTGGPTTAATACGRLTIVDLTALSTTPVQPVAVIPDGYHTKIDISDDGQLFVGSRTCTNIVPVNPGDEQRGCLAILNTNNGNLIIPPDNGDVTGLQPVTGRTVFYVVEGGQFRIYDTTTDKLSTVSSIDILGNAVDVKLIDF
jgi:hypothetical protein